MASVAASMRAGIRGLTPEARQLGYAWLFGSVTLGTVALIVLRTKPALAVPLRSGQTVVPFGTDGSPVPPIALLPGWAQMTIFVLVAALVIALFALGWRTAALTWLPREARGRLLWGVIVSVAGLAAWFFAATVTYGAMFGPNLQLVLAYVGGGLPFALIAAMLLKPWRANVWAVGLSAGLVAAGFILVALRSPGQPSALRDYFQYLWNLFGGGPIVVY